MNVGYDVRECRGQNKIPVSYLLDDGGIEEQLLVRSLDDLLLDCALGHEAEDAHLLGLTDTVGAVHGLKIHLLDQKE